MNYSQLGNLHNQWVIIILVIYLLFIIYFYSRIYLDNDKNKHLKINLEDEQDEFIMNTKYHLIII